MPAKAGIHSMDITIFFIGGKGAVVEEEGRIYGDGVDIAARVESISEGGGVCISGTAYEHVEHKLDYLIKECPLIFPQPIEVAGHLSIGVYPA
jgi:class 3 adenylate cyclase